MNGMLWFLPNFAIGLMLVSIKPIQLEIFGADTSSRYHTWKALNLIQQINKQR